MLYTFIVIAPRTTWPGVVAPVRVLSMGQNELNHVPTLNSIVWNYLFLHLTVGKQNLYLGKTEFFEIELFSQLTVYKQTSEV